MGSIFHHISDYGIFVACDALLFSPSLYVGNRKTISDWLSNWLGKFHVSDLHRLSRCIQDRWPSHQQEGFYFSVQIGKIGTRGLGLDAGNDCVAIVSLSALSFTTAVLKSVPLFSPHPVFLPDMVDMANNLTPGVLF